MIRLCKTTMHGTSMLGLYRGLKLKTAGTPWRVEVVTGDIDTLRSACADGPLILSVGLPRCGAADTRFETDWGWQRGRKHAVVLFGFTGDGRVEMGDPSVGREHWREEGIRVLYRRQALRLVRQ